MTVKRHPDSEELELKLGTGTVSFRVALFVLIASMHPLGQNLLTGMGFPVPSASTSAISRDIDNMKQDIKDIKSEVIDVRSEQRRLKFQLSGLPHPFLDLEPK